jgi:hypothetical protein
MSARRHADAVSTVAYAVAILTKALLWRYSTSSQSVHRVGEESLNGLALGHQQSNAMLPTIQAFIPPKLPQ